MQKLTWRASDINHKQRFWKWCQFGMPGRSSTLKCSKISLMKSSHSEKLKHIIENLSTKIYQKDICTIVQLLIYPDDRYSQHFCLVVPVEWSTSEEAKEFASVHGESMGNNHGEELSPNQTYPHATLDVESGTCHQRETNRIRCNLEIVLSRSSFHYNHVTKWAKQKFKQKKNNH